MAKNKNLFMWIAVGFVALVAFGFINIGNFKLGNLSVGSSADNTQDTPTIGAQDLAGCFIPDTGLTATTLDIVNALNTSGSEGLDAETRFYADDGSQTVRITDTTSPSATNLKSGKAFTAKIESTNAENGINSVMKEVRAGEATIADGNLHFNTCGGAQTLEVAINKQGQIEARAFDIINNGYMFSSASTVSATLYRQDGVTFNTTSAGTAGTAVGSGGKYSARIELQARNSSRDAQDRGELIMFDGTNTVWDWSNAVVKVNGVQVQPAILNSDEKLATSAYEAVYEVPLSVQPSLTQNNQQVIEFTVYAFAGQNPAATTDDLQVDVVFKGAYQATSQANQLKVGAYTDAASHPAVRTVFDTAFRVS